MYIWNQIKILWCEYTYAKFEKFLAYNQLEINFVSLAPGLSLIIGKDGTAAVGEQRGIPGAEFQPVIIEKR